MKKIISLFSALAVSVSMFAAFATASYAAPTESSSNPEIQGYVADALDSDGYAVLKFKLVNNEALSYAISKGKVTSNAINTIQVKVKLSSTVFDTTETYITASTSGVNVSGDNTDTLTYLFAPTTVDTFLTSVPEQLFEIAVLLNDGYTLENIPNDAVTFGETILEYTAYKGVKPAENNLAEQEDTTNGTYTIYAVNAATSHYPLTVGFTGSATTDPDPDPDPTPSVTPAVAGKEIENGYKTFSAPAPAVLATSAENLITVTKSGDTERKLTHTLPAGVAGGKTKVLPIVSYKIGEKGVNAADVFTITVTSGSDTIATYTYTVPNAE